MRSVKLPKSWPLFLAGALALGGGAWFWWQGRPARHLSEARRLIAEGGPEEALTWLNLPEASRSTRDEALVLRARAAVERNRPAEAVGPLNRIDPYGPWGADADYWKARALYHARSTRLAVAWFRRVLARRPDDRDALRWLAAAAYDLGDWKTAVISLEHLTRLRPDDAPAWRTLGLLYKEENQFEQARKAYEASLKYAPGQARVRLELAETLVKLGRFGDAERPLAQCRGGVPEGDRLALLAECLRARDDRDGLRTLLESAAETCPDHTGVLEQRALLALVEGRGAEALSLLDRAHAAGPQRSRSIYYRAQALALLGKRAEAAREFQRSKELTRLAAKLSDLTRRANDQPDDAQVRCELASLSLELGDRPQAAYWYRAALACDPTDEKARAGVSALGQATATSTPFASSAR